MVCSATLTAAEGLEELMIYSPAERIAPYSAMAVVSTSREHSSPVVIASASCCLSSL